MDAVMKASSELANIIPERWSENFYPTLLESLAFTETVARSYEGEIQQLGDIVNILSFPEFDTAKLIAEDERADASAITATNTQLTINKLAAKDYIVTMTAKKQAIDHAMELQRLAMFAVMKRIQEEIITATVPSASAPDHQIAYDSGSTLALADILEAKELLDGQDVPDDGMRVLIAGSAQFNDLFNISGFTSRDFIPAGSPLVTGSFNTPLLGFIPRHASGAGAVTYLFHPSYLQLAVQTAPVAEVFNLGVDGKRAERVNFSALFGLVQADDVRVVEIS